MNRAGMSPGFSLVELMVTVALVTLILGLFAAYTSSSSFRLEAAANSLYATLQKTRLEAIMRNRNVSLSFDLDVDGNIDNQMTMWVDENSNNAYDGAAELVEAIPREPLMAFGSVASGEGGPSMPPPTRTTTPTDGVDFNTAGNSNCTFFSPDGTSASGVVIVHSSTNSSAGTYAIVLSSVGLPRMWYYQPGTSAWKDR